MGCFSTWASFFSSSFFCLVSFLKTVLTSYLSFQTCHLIMVIWPRKIEGWSWFRNAANLLSLGDLPQLINMRQKSKTMLLCVLKQRAPATEATYSRAIENWCLYSWQLSQNEPESKSFAKEEPDPSAQTLKLFAGDFVVTHKDLPSQSTVRHSISCFVVEWERKTGWTLPKYLKSDVYNVGVSFDSSTD